MIFIIVYILKIICGSHSLRPAVETAGYVFLAHVFSI